MKRHVFKCVKRGWGRETEGVWFDADVFTKEDAEAQFVPVHKMVKTESGYQTPFTFYEYAGEIYYSVEYEGEYDEDDMPGML